MINYSVYFVHMNEKIIRKQNIMQPWGTVAAFFISKEEQMFNAIVQNCIDMT